MITVWTNKEQDTEIEKLAGIAIPITNGPIMLGDEQIGWADSFTGLEICHTPTEEIIAGANKYCVWNS